jgi:hypothetical protein
MAKKQLAMRPETLGCRIDVREYGQTYIARAEAMNIVASCTCGAKAAAEACADKVFGSGNWSMVQCDAKHFVCSRNVGVAKPARAWRDPAAELPDDEITVAVRMKYDDEAVAIGYHEGDDWHLFGSPKGVERGDVTGWMHLHEAARILDAAERGEVQP